MGRGNRVEEEPEAEREEIMNEHEKDTRTPDERYEALGTVSGRVKRGDLVVDLSGIKELDLTSLALLLTAQQRAEKEDRGVWLAGVPLQMWKALHAMGLGGLFKPFPVSGEVAV
jgi:ABC-type transporter Mla MlaB component